MSCGNHIFVTFCVYCTACMDILGNGIISHFGVYSAHLLCNGNNSCCLCLAFTVRFIHKHQLPMVLEDPNAKKPSCLWQSYYRHSMSLSILHAWIFCTLLESSLWCIKCTFTMHYAMTTMFVACVCLAFTSLWVYCMLGYSGKWHHYSVENSLWCIECRFTMQWQQYLLPVSYSLFKTLP